MRGELVAKFRRIATGAFARSAVVCYTGAWLILLLPLKN
jgi:hypothetical protein